MRPEDFDGKLVRIKPGKAMENKIGKVPKTDYSRLPPDYRAFRVCVEFTNNFSNMYDPEDLEIVEENYEQN